MALITLATAVRNDYEGVVFTVNSAWMSVRGTPLEDKLAIVVVNNSDDQYRQDQITGFCADCGIPCKIIKDRMSNHLGRNEAVRMSKTEYTVLADAHVLFMPGFFSEYLRILQDNPHIGLIHSPFTTNSGLPSPRANCFYNLAKFHTNLHGSFSHHGALLNEMYPVALAPHAGYGFRTKEWLDFGGYIDECYANGGGEPYVSYKYWMFGSSAWLTPNTGFIHVAAKALYGRSQHQWKFNHLVTAMALGGLEAGHQYAPRLHGVPWLAEAWKLAEPYHKFVLSRQKVPFSQLLNYFGKVSARPFVA